MSTIGKQGIWIDCKALLELTYELQNHLTNKDRLIIGDRMVKANIDMIEAFATAYSRGDEKFVYDDGEVFYEINLKGCKRKEMDRLQAQYEHYRALWEFVFTLDLQRWNAEQAGRKRAEFVQLLAKIEKGISKWKSGTARQVIVSKTRHDSDQTL